MFPYPLAVCDIGGTNARFAYARALNEPLIHLSQANTARYPDLASACAGVFASAGVSPASLIACAAGPVINRTVRLTNIHWTIDGPEVAHSLGLTQGLLLNDFEALALTLPALKADSVLMIGTQDPLKSNGQTRLVLGPGTGLGVAALVEADGRYLVLPSEAGHTEFAPADKEETEIFALVEKSLGRLTAEMLISGPGLVRLYKARQLVHGASHPDEVSQPQDITRLALADSLGVQAAAIRHFWKLTARFAGDMALAFSAGGGVTLAGGILPKLTRFLDQEEFRSAFANKPPMAKLLERIHTQLLVNEGAVLEGMRSLADRPDLYHLGFSERYWL